MAGRPKTRATLDALQALAVKMMGEGTSALEYVSDILASGERMLDLCDLLAKPAGPLDFTPSYGMVQNALEMEAGGKKQEVAAALSVARRQGAHSKVEQAEQIADTVGADRDQVARAKLQAEMRTWAASRNNRDAYGDQKVAGVEINIGELHLGALQRIQTNGPPRVLPSVLPAALAEVVEAELVPNEDSIESLFQ